GLWRRRREDAGRIRQIFDALRQPADPPRVEQTRALLVETIEVELKIPGPFDEEWPPFGEEGFERGQVHDGWVGFDLSEVWIDRGRQRQAWRNGVLEIEPERRVALGPFAERVVAGILARHARH